jgi:hypothetical protein
MNNFLWPVVLSIHSLHPTSHLSVPSQIFAPQGRECWRKRVPDRGNVRLAQRIVGCPGSPCCFKFLALLQDSYVCPSLIQLSLRCTMWDNVTHSVVSEVVIILNLLPPYTCSYRSFIHSLYYFGNSAVMKWGRLTCKMSSSGAWTSEHAQMGDGPGCSSLLGNCVYRSILDG